MPPATRAERGGRSCRSLTPRRSRNGIAATADATPNEVRAGPVPDAAACHPSSASRYAAVALKSAAPPTVPAAPGPGSKESHTPAAIRSGAAAPTAPATGGAGGSGWTRGSAHPADGASRRTIARSASHAARCDARSIVGVTPPGALPAVACAVRSSRSEACRAAAGASRLRRSASPPSRRAPQAGSDTSGAAPKASVSIARRLPATLPAADAAHTVPTPARPSAISCRCGHRRSP